MTPLQVKVSVTCLTQKKNPETPAEFYCLFCCDSHCQRHYVFSVSLCICLSHSVEHDISGTLRTLLLEINLNKINMLFRVTMTLPDLFLAMPYSGISAQRQYQSFVLSASTWWWWPDGNCDFDNLAYLCIVTALSHLNNLSTILTHPYCWS